MILINQEKCGELKCVFLDGKLIEETTLSKIRRGLLKFI